MAGSFSGWENVALRASKPTARCRHPAPPPCACPEVSCAPFCDASVDPFCPDVSCAPLAPFCGALDDGLCGVASASRFAPGPPACFAAYPASRFVPLENRPAAERSACLPRVRGPALLRPGQRRAEQRDCGKLVLVAVSSHPRYRPEEPGVLRHTMDQRGSTRMFCDMF